MELIYGLVDPRYGCIRYVGMTTRTPEDRLIGHLREATRYPRAHKSLWIRQLASQGLVPYTILLETVIGRWQDAERRWIAHFGDSLTNMTAGGDGRVGRPHSEETRRKIGAANKGRVTSTETRELIRQKMIARGGPSLERRARISSSLRGRVQSQEAVARRRASLMANADALKKVAALTGSVPRDVLIERAAKGAATRRHRGNGLAEAPRNPCDQCGRMLRRIDMPRHRCTPVGVS